MVYCTLFIYVSNIPTQKAEKSKSSWIFNPWQDQNGPKGPGPQKEKGARQTVCLVATRQMLPKANRADKKMIDHIFARGKFVSSPTFSFKYIFAEDGAPHISFIAPKSVSKLAVRRNTLKRCGYKALNEVEADLPPVAGVFIFKKQENDAKKIGKEIGTILGKIARKND